jgi:hypothetical protein
VASLPDRPQSPNAVALNDTVDLVRLLTEGSLFRVLNQPRALAASCGTDCTCNDSMCTCRAARSTADEEAMTVSELDAMRTDRIKQLKSQLAAIEAQLQEAEGHGSPGQSAAY